MVMNHIYRKRWRENRMALEEKGLRTFPLAEGRKIPRRDPMGFLFKIFKWLLKLTPFYKWGQANAEKLIISENLVETSKVAGESLRILHLSDIHLDESIFKMEDLKWRIKECEPYHLVCITGDLVTGWPLKEDHLEKIKDLVGGLKPSLGNYMVLGNHDSGHLVKVMEELGVQVLTNQLVTYHKNNQLPLSFEIIGTDDPHYFFQKDALKIFDEGDRNHFRLALVHTPELFEVAEKANCDLYLCGHTHGGQIALPGGIPIIKRIYRGKKFAVGKWQYKNMQGYTSSGIGTSSMPIRFNTRSEIVLHTLIPKNNKHS